MKSDTLIMFIVAIMVLTTVNAVQFAEISNLQEEIDYVEAVRGLQGFQGETGEQGIAGENGSAICGSYYRLEFHHVNFEDKLFSICTDWGRTNTSIVAELNKCVLVCQKCHNEIHKVSK